jgi:hypothetical protein
VRCDCCDLPFDGCGRAAERRQRDTDARERQHLLSQAGARPARYPGACGRCDEHYAANDIIGPPRTAGDPWIGPCCLGAA